MKIVILGSTGFIGKNLLDTIQEDENEWICLVRNKSRYIEPELRNITIKSIYFETDILKKEFENVDVVINLVGQMGGEGITEKQFQESNCQLTEKIIDACIFANIKQIIYISTPGVQGFGNRLCEEDVSYAPRNNYEKTKVQAEKLIINKLENTTVKYTILRPDFVYGPNDYRRLKMYKNIRDRRFILTTSGKSYLGPTYVMDVIQGIMKSINNEKAYNEILNLSAKEDIQVKKYLSIIADYFQVKIIHINIGYTLSVIAASIIDILFKIFFHKEGFVSKNKIDFLAIDHSTSCEKATKKIGYQPQFDFRQGFYETMKWCEKNNLL